jgi:DNA-binding beta-propeller fold protein YncE
VPLRFHPPSPQSGQEKTGAALRRMLSWRRRRCGSCRRRVPAADAIARRPCRVVVFVVALVGAAPSPAAAAGPLGALRQLDGRAGCLAGFAFERTQGCARLRDIAEVADLAISPDGRNVYVAGSLSDTVVALARDARTGRLVQLRGRGACVSARRRSGCATARALRDPGAIAISHDGQNVYVTENDDGVAVFARDLESGALSQLPGAAGCVEPIPRDGCAVAPGVRGGRAVVGPDDRQVYVASAAYDSEAVVTLTRSPRTGALAPLPGSDGCASQLGGEACRRARGLGNAAAVAFSPDGAWAYVPSRTRGSVAIFARGSADGVLRQAADPLGCVSAALPVRFCGRARALEGANDAVVSPDGRHVYVAAFERGVAAFARDLATGQLTQLPGRDGCVSTPATTACQAGRGIVPGLGGGTDRVALAPDGRTLYASSSTGSGGGIAVLRRDPATGAVRELRGRAGCLAAARAGCTPVRGLSEAKTLVISPDGRHAYALSGDYGADAVAVFAVRRPAEPTRGR